MLFCLECITLAVKWVWLTYLVGWRLHTIIWPLFFLARRGSLPAGRICKVVPRHRDRSACLLKTGFPCGFNVQRQGWEWEKKRLTWNDVLPSPCPQLVARLPSPGQCPLVVRDISLWTLLPHTVALCTSDPWWTLLSHTRTPYEKQQSLSKSHTTLHTQQTAVGV